MSYLVSVVVPMYNGEKYIIDFLDSIASQSYRPIELILGDDASTDNTVELCLGWKEKQESEDLSVSIVGHKINRGLSANISDLLSSVNGKVVFLADQDDVWFPNKIEEQCAYLDNKPKCSVCLCDRSVTDENLNIRLESNYRYVGYSITSMDFKEVIKHRAAYGANTMAIRNMGDKVFYIPSGIVCHDTFLAVMASTQGTVDYLYEPLLYYRIHENNLSGNFSAEISDSFLKCFMKRYTTCKRGIKSKQKDGDIIAEELQKRFGISLEEYDNGLLRRKVNTNPLKYAWETTMNDKKRGNIGKWIK